MPDAIQPGSSNSQPAQLCPQLVYSTAQAVPYTGTHAESTAIAASGVILTATSDCYYTVGASPVASSAAGSDFLPAGVKWPLTIVSGQKISAVQVSASGTLYIMPCKVS